VSHVTEAYEEDELFNVRRVIPWSYLTRPSVLGRLSCWRPPLVANG